VRLDSRLDVVIFDKNVGGLDVYKTRADHISRCTLLRQRWTE
jgi:hypothetical protein